MAIAANLEGTLSTGKTYRALTWYLKRSGKSRDYLGFSLKGLPAALASRLQRSRRPDLESQRLETLSHSFRGLPEEAFVDIAEWVVEHELWPKRREDILAALKAHQLAGEQLILSCDLYQPVLEAFGKRIGARALGTRLEVNSGRLTGKLLGKPNNHDAKAERLHNYLGNERLYAAYGSSEADIAMMLLSDRPVAVYPDQVLRKTAQALDWLILE